MDGHPAVRRGICAVFEDVPGASVVGEADSGEDAGNAAEHLRPDLVFTEVALPGMSGIELTADIRRRTPGTRIVIVTSDDSRSSLTAALRAGAAGYLLKDGSLRELVRAAHAVMRDETVVDPRLVEGVLADSVASQGSPLSPRELEVLELVASGAGNREIGALLGISPNTVGTHLHRIRRKLGARGRAEAVAIAIHRRLIHGPP